MHLPITSIKLREKGKREFGPDSTFYPLQVRSPILLWQGNKVENAKEANVWFHPSPLLLLHQKKMEMAQRIKLEMTDSVAQDIQTLEQLISTLVEGFSLKSSLESDSTKAEGKLLTTKFSRDMSVFELTYGDKPRPSSLEAIVHASEEIKFRPLIRITGVFMNAKTGEMNLTTTVDQLHFCRYDRKIRKRALETDEDPHFGESEWTERTSAFERKWIDQIFNFK